MNTASQEWNRIKASDEQPVVKPLAGAPTCSWWIGEAETFIERYRRELPRITGSAMARTIRPMLLGGKLP